MSKTAFAFISIIQLITAFILLFIWKPGDMLFRYRSPSEDPTSYLYYQIDEDLLFGIVFFFFPVAVFLIILSFVFIFLLKKISFRQSVLARISLLLSGIELSIWVNGLIAIIKFSNSLVSCDNFIVGKSLGCYMPS